jgi:hypothetical protein
MTRRSLPFFSAPAFCSAFALFALLAFAPSAAAQEIDRRERPFFVEVEGGAAFPGYADVAVPGDTGTRFSLTNDLDASPTAFVRFRAGVSIAERHTILALVAPFTFSSEGTAPFAIDYAGETFAAGTPLAATYKFNSYRLTYRYSIVHNAKVDVALGVTAKVRDAAIRLRGAGRVADKDDLGVVPLVSFRVAWHFAEPLGFVLDGDALASPSGRAEDIFAGLQLRANDFVAFYGGYRMLEGGGDNQPVYSFAWVHYAALGAQGAF